MTHDELLAEIDSKIEYCTCEGWGNNCWGKENIPWQALRAVVELHQPQDITLPDGSWGENCCVCNNGWTYPCRTIQVIEKELE